MHESMRRQGQQIVRSALVNIATAIQKDYEEYGGYPVTIEITIVRESNPEHEGSEPTPKGWHQTARVEKKPVVQPAVEYSHTTHPFS